MSKFEIVGLMSGTSLDGLDITHSIFSKVDGKWTFRLQNAMTFPYSEELRNSLSEAKTLSLSSLQQLDKHFGRELGRLVLQFLKEKKINANAIDAIASHGQTILHQPNNGFSLQIGCGTSLAFVTGIPVINDFRNKDIIAGGQGAPLVPIGDKLLFSDLADAFLNLGGFCNLTFKNTLGDWKAFDVSPCNLPLNRLAEQKGKSYDKNGDWAREGTVDFFLLDLLNKIPYYTIDSAKSLGTEWLDESFYPLIKFSKNTHDNLCTIVEHVAFQISKALENKSIKKLLVTGGGAHNSYLIERLKHYCSSEIILPDKEIVDFKESIIFGFLGALYLAKEFNNIPSATGASKNVIGGVYHCP